MRAGPPPAPPSRLSVAVTVSRRPSRRAAAQQGHRDVGGARAHVEDGRRRIIASGRERRDRPLAEPRPAGEPVHAGQVAEVAHERALVVERSVEELRDAGQPIHAARVAGRPVPPPPIGCHECHPRRMSETRHRIVVAGESLIDRIVRPRRGGRGGPGRRSVHDGPSAGPPRVPVSFVGGLSTDASGALLRAALAADGVDLSLAVTTDAPTLLAVAALDAAGVATYRFEPAGSAAASLRPADLAGGLPPDTAALHVGTLGLVLEPAADDDRGPRHERAAGRPRRRRPEHPAVGDRRRRRLPGAPGEGARPRRRRPGEPRRPRLARAGSIDPRGRDPDRERRPVRRCCSPTAADRSGS